MLGLGQDRAERAGAVPLELGPDQLDVLGRIQEAVRRAVQRDEALAAGDVVEQGLLLLGRDPRRVGIDHQARVLAERLGIQVVELVRVGQLDPPLLQHRLKLLEPRRRLMVAAVAEEEQLERLGRAERRQSRRMTR